MQCVGSQRGDDASEYPSQSWKHRQVCRQSVDLTPSAGSRLSVTHSPETIKPLLVSTRGRFFCGFHLCSKGPQVLAEEMTPSVFYLGLALGRHFPGSTPE